LICRLAGNDWGLWRTLTDNLEHVSERLDQYPQLTSDDCQVIRERITTLLAAIQATPKTMRWKVRSAIGDKAKWYKDVEELADR
jgi:hypothetical protein